MLKANRQVVLLIGLTLAVGFGIIRWATSPEPKLVQNPIVTTATVAPAFCLSAEICERQCDEKLALANEQDGRFKAALIKKIEEAKQKSFADGARYSCDLCQKNLLACEEPMVGPDTKLQDCLTERNEVRTDLTQARTDLWRAEQARDSLQSQVQTGEAEIAKLQVWVKQLRQGVCPEETEANSEEEQTEEQPANTESNNESGSVNQVPQFYYHAGW